MKTFIFYHKNSSATMALTSSDYDSAREELKSHLKDDWGWRCDNEDGEEE
jgi:hypothetical protein